MSLDKDVNDYSFKEMEEKLEVVRLRVEQQLALNAIAPDRFQRNLSAFKKHVPAIFDLYKDYNPEHDFELFCSENGEPNIKWSHNDTALYGESPFEFCKEQIISVLASPLSSGLVFSKEINPINFIHVDYLNKIVDTISYYESFNKVESFSLETLPCAVMYGVGLGYQLSYLYERCHVSTMFVFEPDLDLFYASLFCFEWGDLLDYLHDEGLNIHIFLGQDEKTVADDFNQVIGRYGHYLLANALYFLHYPSNEIFGLIEKMRSNYINAVMGWGFFDDNIIAVAHSVKNILNGIPVLKRNTAIPKSMSETPIFIVANGPSLDQSINFIKDNQENALIISCGSAISALYKLGIQPDIHVEVERTKAVPDALAILNNQDYLKGIFFISVDVVHPYSTSYFERSAICFKAGEPSIILFSTFFPGELSDSLLLGNVNPLVANIGLSMPAALGFKRLFLFGVDNGYRDKKHHHSKNSAYYSDSDSSHEPEWLNLAVANDSMLTKSNFDNGDVKTNSMYELSRRLQDKMLELHRDVRCYNCSDGAKLDNATPLRHEKIALHAKVNKKEIVDYIHNNMAASKHHSFTEEKIYSSLRIDEFNYMVDKIISELLMSIGSRQEFIDAMKRCYLYIVDVKNTLDRTHTYMMVGTINYLFAIATTALCKPFSEMVINKMMIDIVELMEGYLNDCKTLYKTILDRVDMQDNEVLSLIYKIK